MVLCSTTLFFFCIMLVLPLLNPFFSLCVFFLDILSCVISFSNVKNVLQSAVM